MTSCLRAHRLSRSRVPESGNRYVLARSAAFHSCGRASWRRGSPLAKAGLPDGIRMIRRTQRHPRVRNTGWRRTLRQQRVLQRQPTLLRYMLFDGRQQPVRVCRTVAVCSLQLTLIVCRHTGSCQLQTAVRSPCMLTRHRSSVRCRTPDRLWLPSLALPFRFDRIV